MIFNPFTKKYSRFVSTILFIVMLFNILALPAFAVDLPSNSAISPANQKAILDDSSGSAIGNGLIWGANFILTGALLFMGQIVWLTGKFFDASLIYTQSNFRNIKAIDIGW